MSKKKILIRQARSVIDHETGRRVCLGKFKKHLVREPKKGFSDSKNKIPVADLTAAPHRFVAGKDQYLTIDADFLDQYKGMKRLAQIITLKDIGRIITLLGLTKDSVVVESGSGSGAATVYLARIVKRVYSYEVNEEHLVVAQENVEAAGVDNVTFTKASVYDEVHVGAHEADGYLLDVPEPVRALGSVWKALRMGGRVVVYTPNLTQAQEVTTSLPDGFLNEGTTQVTETEWRVSKKILRPNMQGLGHTAFLTVLRKVPPIKEC